MPLSKPLLDFGVVPDDLLDPLCEQIMALPPSSWVFRGDVESMETMKIRADVNVWLKEATKPIFTWMELHAIRPGGFNRIVLSKVPAQKQILPHTDDRDVDKMHCHLPLITEKKVVLRYPQHKKSYHLKRGHIYRMDKNQEHAVDNPTMTDRIHLLFAYWPHDGNWNAVMKKGMPV